MTPNDPNDPLPTTPVGPETPQPAGAPEQRWGPAGPAPAAAAPQGGWGPPPAQGGWGPPPGWGAPAPFPPPPPPKRDRLALGIVAFIFGGLFLVFFGFLALAWSAVKGESPQLSTGPRIGVVEVRGVIGGGGEGQETETLLKQIRKFANDSGMKAVVVRIDSPGGAVGPSQEIFDEVKRLAAKKPTVCSMGNVAASGGFYVAMGCTKVVAAPGTITGSIGVISQFPNVKGIADRWDFKMETVKSGKLKDAGNPFRDMTPEDRAYWQGLVDRVYAQFLRAVVDARKLPEAKVRAVADGRVITGEEAKEAGLVDALGNFYDAVELAKAEAKLEGEPRLVFPPDDRARFLEEIMGGGARAFVRALRSEVSAEAAQAAQPGLHYLAP
jgi:protease-4